MRQVSLGAFRRLAAPLLVVALLYPLAARSTVTQEEEAGTGQTPAPTALVEIDGRTILRVRGTTGRPAAERAQWIEDRIVEFARDPSLAPDAVRLVENERGTAVVAGNLTLLTVTDGDAALEEMNRQTLAASVLRTVPDVVKNWRFERSHERRLRNLYYTAGASGGLAAFLWLLSLASRRVRRTVQERVASRVKSVGVQSFEVIQASQIQAAVAAVPRLLHWLGVTAAIYLYLDFVLQLFPLTRPLSQRLFWLVVGPLQSFGLGFLNELPNLFFLLVLVFIVRYVLKLMRMYFEAIERGTVQFQRFDAEWGIPTYKVLRIFVVAFALVVAYPYIPGSESAAFKGVSVMLGVLFSLGSSSVSSNVIAGYSMTYRRAFRRGDRIRVGEVLGDVVESGVLVTTLRTPKNEMVVVPNTEILNNSVVNYSAMARDTGLILHTTVGIGYETPWRQVEAMLLIAAERTPDLRREPPPFVLQKALGDFAVTYEINAYTNDAASMMRQYSALHANILDVFNEYGIQIMTPAYVGDPAEPKLVRPGEWYAAPAQGPAPAGPPSTEAAANPR
ncbi:MAG TPA: mechanosensitive ion channel domain-containing protein [Steroidobacteraceae bacterium]